MIPKSQLDLNLKKNAAGDITKVPWYSLSKRSMNRHMAEHSVTSRKFGFTGFDLELSYILGHNTDDFKTICENRIIKHLHQQGKNNGRAPGEVKNFPNIYDRKPVSPYVICFQAQNLVYMYALGLIDVLDKDLIQDTRDSTVINTSRRGKGIYELDGDLPIFDSIIGMKDAISLDDVENVREEYIKKRPLAEEIRYQGRHFNIKLNDIALLQEEQIGLML